MSSMIKKYLIIVFAILLMPSSFAFFWKKQEPPSLFLTSTDPRATIGLDETLKSEDVFRVGNRIYFLIVPFNVDILSDSKDDKSKGTFPWIK